MRGRDALGVPGLRGSARSVGADRIPHERELAVKDEQAQGSTGNLLLDALPASEREAVLVGTVRRPISVGKILHLPGDPITHVYFPTGGTLSMVAQPDDAGPVEAATIGLEGAASIHSALGSRRASQELVCQIEGEMIAMDVDAFVMHAKRGQLERLVFGYIEALLAQISLTAACNALHQLPQRCARWLLQTHDRVHGDTFGLTQEYLGVMLGVQRPSVSIAQRTLQATGCITFRRGSITVLDREGLESTACPCYGAIRTEYSRLVPLFDASH